MLIRLIKPGKKCNKPMKEKPRWMDSVEENKFQSAGENINYTRSRQNSQFIVSVWRRDHSTEAKQSKLFSWTVLWLFLIRL